MRDWRAGYNIRGEFAEAVTEKLVANLCDERAHLVFELQRVKGCSSISCKNAIFPQSHDP
jgi:hypothetical protein